MKIAQNFKGFLKWFLRDFVIPYKKVATSFYKAFLQRQKILSVTTWCPY